MKGNIKNKERNIYKILFWIFTPLLFFYVLHTYMYSLINPFYKGQMAYMQAWFLIGAIFVAIPTAIVLYAEAKKGTLIGFSQSKIDKKPFLRITLYSFLMALVCTFFLDYLMIFYSMTSELLGIWKWWQCVFAPLFLTIFLNVKHWAPIFIVSFALTFINLTVALFIVKRNRKAQGDNTEDGKDKKRNIYKTLFKIFMPLLFVYVLHTYASNAMVYFFKNKDAFKLVWLLIGLALIVIPTTILLYSNAKKGEVIGFSQTGAKQKPYLRIALFSLIIGVVSTLFLFYVWGCYEIMRIFDWYWSLPPALNWTTSLSWNPWLPVFGIAFIFVFANLSLAWLVAKKTREQSLEEAIVSEEQIVNS
ncbi:MAG: hypothetical protein IKA61_00835 [Clostridia bacterium]|nr:hypothetical protein [Clostridia bacterium]